jgi:hypothetical protein
MPSLAVYVVFTASLSATTIAQADIYKCVDPAGHVTYSNVVQPGCQKLNLEPLSTIPAPPKPAAKSDSATQPPAGFPKVDADAQKKRDADRKKILEDELAAEQKQLDESRKALAEQEAVRSGDEKNYQRVLDRLQPYKDKVALHERNVEALKKELANAK